MSLPVTEASWEAYALALVRMPRGEHPGAAADLAPPDTAADLRALLAWIVAHCETPLADDPERLAAAVALLTRTGGVS